MNDSNMQNYLPMCPHYRSEKFEGSSPPIDSDHSQNLEESESTKCTRSEDVVLIVSGEHYYTRYYENDV